MTIKTTASIKKITSGKGVEIVLCLPSSVSLDDLNELKQRDEFYLALGISQMEIKDYIEPRRGLQVVEKSGVIESVSDPDGEEGEQLAIEDVAVSDSEESAAPIEDESDVSEDDIPFVDDADAEEDPDAPITFLDEE